MTDVDLNLHRDSEPADKPVSRCPPLRRHAAPPRFDEDDEWDANGWERVPTWERRP